MHQMRKAEERIRPPRVLRETDDGCKTAAMHFGQRRTLEADG